MMIDTSHAWFLEKVILNLFKCIQRRFLLVWEKLFCVKRHVNSGGVNKHREKEIALKFWCGGDSWLGDVMQE